MNDFEQGGDRRKIAVLALVLVLIGAIIYAWHWKKEYDDLVEPSLTVYNLTDQDVEVSVGYARFPESGASMGLGPHSGGGGMSCCVPIPTHWRPGIKMVVTYHFGPGPKDEILSYPNPPPPPPPENQVIKIVDLPEYQDGRPGRLVLVFYSTSEFELFSTIFAPEHPRWPGRRFVPVMEGVE